MAGFRFHAYIYTEPDIFQQITGNLCIKTETMLTKELCRGARAMLDWSRTDLAKAAGLSDRTITDYERGAREPHDNNKRAMQEAFEKAGLEFIPANGGGAGIRFRDNPAADPILGVP
ncbi:helix-turn-helix domain-containing protein (plasmid) [Methylobacterium sp. CM6241]